VPGLLALLGLLIAALALHAAVLGWLASQWREPDVLRPMVAPLLTRQIAAVVPPAAAAAAQPEAPKFKPKRPKVPVKSDVLATKTVADIAPEPTTGADTTETVATPTVPDPPQKVAQTAPELPRPETASTEPAPVAAATESLALSAPAWPADTLLSYRLGGNYRGELTGDARVQWQRDGARYQVQVDLDIGWFVRLVMTSQGNVTPAGLYPTAFVETLRARRRTAVLGDDTITLGNGTQVPRPAGVQDTASQFVELAWRFQNGLAPLEVGKSVSFWMARPGGVDRWTYNIVGAETLYLPRLGPVQAFHLTPGPIAHARGNINAEMWFAPSLQYLPVRIRITLGTERTSEQFVDLLVDKIEQR
jgi:Protein of unknown function (DUF3108)